MRDMDLIISTITEGMPAQEAAKVSVILDSLDRYLNERCGSDFEAAMKNAYDLSVMIQGRKTFEGGSYDPEYYRCKSMTNRQLQAMMMDGLTGMDAFDVGCILKYLYRYPNKGGQGDVLKVMQYLTYIRERYVWKYEKLKWGIGLIPDELYTEG